MGASTLRLAEYDPATVIFTWGGVPLPLEAASGEFVTLERRKPVWTLPIGIDGEATRVRTNDKSGIVRFRMRQAALNSVTLSGLLISNELTGLYGGFAAGLPFILTDIPSGSNLWSAPTAILEGWPIDGFGTDEGVREWRLLCNPLLPFLGGRS